MHIENDKKGVWIQVLAGLCAFFLCQTCGLNCFK